MLLHGREQTDSCDLYYRLVQVILLRFQRVVVGKSRDISLFYDMQIERQSKSSSSPSKAKASSNFYRDTMKRFCFEKDNLSSVYRQEFC